jgi:O-antigen/teichoic acid export membrane protein
VTDVRAPRSTSLRRLRRLLGAPGGLAPSGLLLAGEAGAAAFGFAFGLLGARAVGLRQYGFYGVATAAAATALIVLDVRLEDLVLRRFQEHLAGDDDGTLWSGYLWGDLGFGVVRSVVLVIPVLAIPSLRTSVGGQLFSIVVLGSTITTSDASVRAVLNAQGQHVRVASARVAPQLAAVIAVLLFSPRSATGVTVIAAITPVCGTMMLWSGLARSLHTPRSVRWFIHCRSDWLRTVALLSVGSTLRGPAANFDQLIVGGVLGPTKAGTYRLAKSFASLPGIVAATLRFAAMPGIMRAAVNHDKPRLRSELTRLTIISATVGGAATIMWVLFGRLILRFLGPAFQPVYWVAVLLFVAGWVDYTTSWSKTLPVILERPQWALVEGGLYLVVTPLVLLAGAEAGGLNGTALAVIVVTTFGSVAWMTVAARRLRSGEMPTAY